MPYNTRRRRQCSLLASPLQELQPSQGRSKRRKQPSLKQLESQEYLGSTQKKKKSRITKTKNDPTTIMSSPASDFNAVKPPFPSNLETSPQNIEGDEQNIGYPSTESIASTSSPSDSSDDSGEPTLQTDSIESEAGIPGQNTQVEQTDHLASSVESGCDSKTIVSESTSKTKKVGGSLPKTCDPDLRSSASADNVCESEADDSKTLVSESTSETKEVGGSLPKTCDPDLRSSASADNVDESGGNCSRTDANVEIQVAESNESEGSDDGGVSGEGSGILHTDSPGSICNESESKTFMFDDSSGYLSNNSSDSDDLDRKKPEHSTELKTPRRIKTTPKSTDFSPKKLSFDDSSKKKKNRRASKVVRLPSDVRDFGADKLEQIDRKLEDQHECFTRFRDYGERSEFPFLNDVIFSVKYDMPYVQKTFKDCRSPAELYGNYAILDITTQWIFRRNPERFDLHLPACAFYLMSRRGVNNSDPVMDLSKIVRGWENFFEFTVIPIIVWHGQHFSIAYIVNAGVILKKKLGRKSVSDLAPCILYSNSLPGGSVHNKCAVSKILRSFLNRMAGTRMFSKDNMKAYDIETCVQLDGFSCAYHTILSRDAVLKELRRRTISVTDIKNNFRYRDFRYKEEDAMKVRAGIYELVSAINAIKNPESSSCQSGDVLERLDSPFHRPEAEAKKEIERAKKEARKEAERVRKAKRDADRARKEEIREEKRLKREQRRREKEMIEELKGQKPDELVKAMREKKTANRHVNQKRKEDMARMNEWQSRLETKVTEEEREKRMAEMKRPLERKLGEPVRAMEQTHDRAFRRACYNAVKASSTFAATCRYPTHYESMIMPRPKAFLVIIDPMSELPHDLSTPIVREQPLRIVVGANKQEYTENLKDMITNVSNTVFSDDAEDVDKLLLGPDRISLNEFISKKKKRDVEEERTEDRSKRSNAREDITKSVRKNAKETEKVRIDDGF